MNGAPRNWRARLTAWERVRLSCLETGRAHVRALAAERGVARTGRSDPTSKLFTARMKAIRNRACQRARIADGVHAACTSFACPRAALGADPGETPIAQQAEQ